MKNKRWYWLTERAKFDHATAHHALDALRYDGARVESNAPEGYYLFSTDAETHHQGPVLARLASHGLGPDWVCDRPMSYDLASSDAWAWYHRERAKVQR
jgi:hypothetical protein